MTAVSRSRHSRLVEQSGDRSHQEASGGANRALHRSAHSAVTAMFVSPSPSPHNTCVATASNEPGQLGQPLEPASFCSKNQSFH